jgi:NADH-quinone oxidoreductase subunit J
MFLTSVLFFTFTALCLLSSLFVISTKNPVFSILFLIFTFFNVSCILFLFNFEFLPISFLVIYVGAIAVLFLFVLMMLNIKLAELQETDSHFLPVALIFGIVFVVELLCLFRLEFDLLNIFNQDSVIYLFDILQVDVSKLLFSDYLVLNSNIRTISIALFNDYLYCFVLSGFVLLLAMISAIVLTLQKRFVSKAQNVYVQIMRDYDDALVHYR